ncbi:hypothetical protein [Streptomyces sp. AM 2-1-1]|uniref:hypothetical protein n=1 Tax=Streptomyces sp. AM 2-1-1 TaxID=3028709 RepID=UPI0023B92440|nr:hypothetical protein [Streptomyces sp. AM 2-1-1]WEH39518.1 hypothetical protein PZB77_08315 [Streptomyces sp. AM 2-1-1]
MRRVVRGFWGPRVESVEALAERWDLTLHKVAELLGDASGTVWEWRRVRASGADDTPLARGREPLAGVLREARTADDWSDRVGTGLRVIAAPGAGVRVEISGLAGGAPEFLLHSVVVAVEAPDGAEVPEGELLAALAHVWDPDFGDVSDDDLLDALEDEAGHTVGDPLVGRYGYLSPARAALIPDGLGAGRRELPGGGVLLALGGTAQVLTAYEALGAAGALRPLPRPLDRAVL